MLVLSKAVSNSAKNFFRVSQPITAVLQGNFSRMSMDDSANEDYLAKVRSLFPRLTNALNKGDCGRIGVVGGSAEYTGAPYFAAMTTIRMGADLCYMFAHPEAAPVLKSYSPELMIHPTQNFDVIRSPLSRLHIIVFGPGIGRETERLVPLMTNIFKLLRESPNLGMVIDADGLFLISASRECMDEVKGLRNQVILTPNAGEFERIYEAAGLKNETDGAERVKKLANYLQVCILLKGDTDIISDGTQVCYGRVPGSMRRCGGQGDIMSGATALFAYWAKLRDCMTTGASPKTAEFRAAHFLEAAQAASDFVRNTAARTFAHVGRPMTATDVIAEIPDFVRAEIDGKNS